MSHATVRTYDLNFYFERKGLKAGWIVTKGQYSDLVDTTLSLRVNFDHYDSNRTHLQFYIISTKSFLAELTFSCISDSDLEYKEMAPKFRNYLISNEWFALQPISKVIPADGWGAISINLTISNLTAQLSDCLGIVSKFEPSHRGHMVVETLNNLLSTQKFSDIELVSMDKKTFRAHKVILQCASPVFAAMLEHDMVEKQTNKIIMDDISGDVIAEMLNYIYTGKCSNVAVPTEKLMYAVNKYQLYGLRDNVDTIKYFCNYKKNLL